VKGLVALVSIPLIYTVRDVPSISSDGLRDH